MDEVRAFWERKGRAEAAAPAAHDVLLIHAALRAHEAELAPHGGRFEPVLPLDRRPRRGPPRAHRVIDPRHRAPVRCRRVEPATRAEGSMKKLINDPDAVVREALEGIEAAHGDSVRVIHDPMVIVRADAPVQGKVGIISGGGSGHEPMHGGFVGRGMLDAACPGEVFTSPTPDQMLEATKAVDGGAGVLHIVKNYTGDVLNFEMAADLAKGEGIEVEAVVTNDDVAVQDSLYTAGPPRRRHHRDRREDLRRRRRGGPVAGAGRRAVPQGQRPGPQHGHGAHAVHHARARASRASSSPTTRWRSGSASTASRAATARSSRRRRRSSTGWRARSSRTCRTSPATACWRSSTAWAARR